MEKIFLLLHLIKNLTITISVFNTIFVVTFILFGNEILTIFFGDRYGSGGVYLTLKSIQFSALSIEGLLTLIISLLEKSRTIVLVGVFALFKLPWNTASTNLNVNGFYRFLLRKNNLNFKKLNDSDLSATDLINNYNSEKTKNRAGPPITDDHRPK